MVQLILVIAFLIVVYIGIGVLLTASGEVLGRIKDKFYGWMK